MRAVSLILWFVFPFVRSACTLSMNSNNSKELSMDCTSSTIRFIGIGDWGEAHVHPGLVAVRDGILSQVDNTDFIVSVGDNFYNTGIHSITDPQWKTTWMERFSIGSRLTIPWFSILGNHDHYGNSTAQIEYTGTNNWYLPSPFYTIKIQTRQNEYLKLVMIDTMKLEDYTWISTQINDSNASFVIVIGHYQIYSAGTRGDTTDPHVVKLHRILQESRQTKAYVCGHEHDMQYLVSDHLDYFTIGGGGRVIDYTKPSRETMAKVQYYTRNYGFAVFEVNLATHKMTSTYHIYNKMGDKVDTKIFTKMY